MSAQQYGARLLSEVEELSLDEFLRGIRIACNPEPRGVFGVRQVDELLELFRYCGHSASTAIEASALQNHASYYGDDRETHDPEFSAPSAQSKHRLSTVEITSSHSASGKTSLLYYLTALALLPNNYGGKASAVIWFDADGCFSAVRLVQIMNGMVNARENTTSNLSEQTIHQALLHLHVLHPQSSSQLLSMLQEIPSYLLFTSSHQLSSRCLGVIILDSATAFTFQDRLDSDIARLEAGTTAHQADIVSRTSQIQAALQSQQRKFDCPVLFTTTSYTSPRMKRTQELDIPQEAPAVSTWTAFATMSLIIQRATVPHFAPNMSIAQCLGDREKRQEAVSKSRFIVSLDWGGSERWQPDVRNSVSKLPGRGTFGMRIAQAGVEFE